MMLRTRVSCEGSVVAEIDRRLRQLDKEALRYSTAGVKGFSSVFGPQNSPFRHLALDKLCLDAGGRHQGVIGAEEALLVILDGKCSVSLSTRISTRKGSGHEESKIISWRSLGERPNPFTGSPAAVYIPENWNYEVEAECPTRALIVRSPWPGHESGARCEAIDGMPGSKPDGEAPIPILIRPQDVKVVSVGAANWRRDVRFILGPNSPSRRLFAAETLNPPGNWSGFPPHKHDTASGTEAVLEEFYHFTVNPSDSYGIQRVYDYSNMDQAMVVREGDVVIFPRGYHPTVAPPGTTLCYFWAIAGPEKALKVTVDPCYSWLTLAEGIIREMQWGPGAT
ncbi:MAG: 5-deoxy-glucuronate isomerase [Bacillota bacterium]